MRDMLDSVKKQMEDERKFFKDKLSELKSTVNEQPPLNRGSYATVEAKGNSIIEELDRMKERLQKARQKPNIKQPSDRKMNDIVIENPMVLKQENKDQYEPIRESTPISYMESSLPNNKVLKSAPILKQEKVEKEKSPSKRYEKPAPQNEALDRTLDNEIPKSMRKKYSSVEESKEEISKPEPTQVESIKNEPEVKKSEKDESKVDENTTPQRLNTDKLDKSFKSDSIMIKGQPDMGLQKHELKKINHKYTPDEEAIK